jgi:hypothetical protein
MDPPTQSLAETEHDMSHYYMPTEEQIQKTMRFFGFDRLVAIRHLQGQRLALEHAQRNRRYK